MKRCLVCRQFHAEKDKECPFCRQQLKDYRAVKDDFSMTPAERENAQVHEIEERFG